MLANQTDRVYCDIEDLGYAVNKLVQESDKCDTYASEADSSQEAMQFVTNSSIYTGAAMALKLIATMRIANAADFMVAFNRMAFEQYSPYKKGNTNEEN